MRAQSGSRAQSDSRRSRLSLVLGFCHKPLFLCFKSPPAPTPEQTVVPDLSFTLVRSLQRSHLDLHAVLWLQDYLIKWPKTIIVVSHAREFLNTVVTDIVHLQSKTFTVYKGDYNTFEGTRAERVRNAQKAAESASIRRAEVQAFIDKFRFNAKRAALVQARHAVSEGAAVSALCVRAQSIPAPPGSCCCRARHWGGQLTADLLIIAGCLLQSRIKALERMQEVKVMEEDPECVPRRCLVPLRCGCVTSAWEHNTGRGLPLSLPSLPAESARSHSSTLCRYVFHFPEPDQLAAPLLGFNDVNFSYPGSSRVIFRDVNFGASPLPAPRPDTAASDLDIIRWVCRCGMRTRR